MEIEKEILWEYAKHKKQNPDSNFVEFIEIMTWVELVSAILSHVPKSAYEYALESIK